MGICKQFLATLFLSVAMQAGGQPVNLPVTAAGWWFSHASGGGASPNGTNGCYAAYVGKCSQDLGKSPEDIQGTYPVKEGFYTITLSAWNKLYSYPAHYIVEIDYGTQKLCAPDGWATGDVTTVTLVCPSPGYLIVDRQLPSGGPPQGTNHLVLSFSVDYWEGLSDNFTVTFTPTN